MAKNRKGYRHPGCEKVYQIDFLIDTIRFRKLCADWGWHRFSSVEDYNKTLDMITDPMSLSGLFSLAHDICEHTQIKEDLGRVAMRLVNHAGSVIITEVELPGHKGHDQEPRRRKILNWIRTRLKR